MKFPQKFYVKSEINLWFKKSITLCQYFSTQGNLSQVPLTLPHSPPPGRGTWRYLETFLFVRDGGEGGGGVLQASSGCYRATINTLQGTGRALQLKNYLAQNGYNTKTEKPLFKWKLFLCEFKYLKLVCWISTNHGLTKTHLLFKFNLYLF